MTALEIVLLLCGIVCVVVSFVMGVNDKEDGKTRVIQAVQADLTERQKEMVRRQVANIVEEELQNIDEKTEASLDKISNTKILEMNEYADSVISEINKNHNETVFLYDMLNEKAKEIKGTVRDVNIAQKNVERIKSEIAELEKSAQQTGFVNLLDEAEIVEEINNTFGVKNSDENDVNNVVTEKCEKTNISTEAEKKPAQRKRTTSKTTKNTRTSRSTKNTSKNTRKISDKPDPVLQEEAAQMNIQFEKGANNNEKILKLYDCGMNNKEIAKNLNLGVGEVKLVIDLYNSAK